MARTKSPPTDRPKNKPAGPSRVVAKVRGAKLTNSKAQCALVSPDKPLTDQQRRFVKFWAEGNSIHNASYLAGYSDSGTSAYRMAYQPNILALYNEEKRKYEEAGEMTRKRVIDGLLEAVDMAKMLAEPATMVQGWKTIGQMCGYFAPVEVKHTVTHQGKLLLDRMNSLSDEELLALIAKQAEQQAQELLPAPGQEQEQEDEPA